MAPRTLSDFLEELGQAGELVRVEAPVDPLVEAAAITDRIARAGGPALLFGTVRGSGVPLVTNVLGSGARLLRALGAGSLDEATQHFAAQVSGGEAAGWFDRLRGGQEGPGRRLAPRSVRTGVCQQIARLGADVDLGELPVLQSWPGETARVITAGQVVVDDREGGVRQFARYDAAILDRQRLALIWDAHQPPAQIMARWSSSEPLPVALVLGGDPLNLLSAMAPLPQGVDPLLVAGILRQKPVDLVACRSVPLEVPAEAEMVIEGHIDPRESPASVGQVGTPSGRFRQSVAGTVMHVTAILQRANPVYPAIVFAPPPHEAAFIARAMWRICLPLVRQAIPEVVDCDLPLFGAVRHWALVSIRKRYPGHAHKVAQSLWGFAPTMFSKLLVLVDEDVSVQDYGQVLSAVAENTDLARDVLVQPGPADPLDAAAADGPLTTRMAIDATSKLPAETARPWPAKMRAESAVLDLIRQRWPEYGLGPDPDEPASRPS